MAGYSNTPLIQKLGLKEDMKAVFVDVPEGGIVNLPTDQSNSLENDMDYIHIFVTDQQRLESEFSRLAKHLSKAGMLWVSWPKKTSTLETDVNENIVREIGLAAGLVDVKVCAIDSDWSGLKFVYRLIDRR